MLDFENPLQHLEERLSDLRERSKAGTIDLSREIDSIEHKIQEGLSRIHATLTPWQKVQIARHPRRPHALDYIERICEDFEPLSGDRAFREDPAIVGGIGQFNGKGVVILGHQKGRDTKENILRKFGCPTPEGYRKALRLMKLGEKFRLPVITLIDTPGAYPGVESEERHVAEAIAVNLREMMVLQTPIISVVIGEGGSGGALGIAVSNKVFIFQNAYYSVISPEGCAAILWKDRSYASKAAEALKITAPDLLELKAVDGVIEEPLGGAHRDWDKSALSLQQTIAGALADLGALSSEQLLQERYQKFRLQGQYVQ